MKLIEITINNENVVNDILRHHEHKWVVDLTIEIFDRTDCLNLHPQDAYSPDEIIDYTEEFKEILKMANSVYLPNDQVMAHLKAIVEYFSNGLYEGKL